MKKYLLEFRAGSKGDMLLGHFTKKSFAENNNKTSISGNTALRNYEFLIQNNIKEKPDSILQKQLIDEIINSEHNFISVHNLLTLFDVENIETLSKKVNIIQLIVEEKFYNQVHIDSLIKVLCNNLSGYEKVVYNRWLHEKYGNQYKTIKIKNKLEHYILQQGLENNKHNRLTLLKNKMFDLDQTFENFIHVECESFIINYSKLFFEPYEDYFSLCNFINVNSNLDEFLNSLKNSFISNPFIFDDEKIDLTKYGYHYWN